MENLMNTMTIPGLGGENKLEMYRQVSKRQAQENLSRQKRAIMTLAMLQNQQRMLQKQEQLLN